MLSTALLALTLPAHALSPEYGVGDARPLDGGSDVALNVAPVVELHDLWVSTESAPERDLELVLIDVETEERVPSIVREIGANLYRVLPEAELDADTEYAVFVVPGIYGDEHSTPVTQFITGAAADVDVPTIPQPIGVAQESHTDEWGDWHLFSVEQRPAIDPVGVVYSVVVESVACARAGDCGAPPISWALGGVTMGEPSHTGDSDVEVMYFSRDPAGGSDPLATLDPADSVVRIYTEDLAGNEARMVCSIPDGVDAAAVGCEDAAAVGVHGLSDHDDADQGGEDPADDPAVSEPAGDDKASGCTVAGASPAVTLAVLSLAAVARRRDSFAG